MRSGTKQMRYFLQANECRKEGETLTLYSNTPSPSPSQTAAFPSPSSSRNSSRYPLRAACQSQVKTVKSTYSWREVPIHHIRIRSLPTPASPRSYLPPVPTPPRGTLANFKLIIRSLVRQLQNNLACRARAVCLAVRSNFVTQLRP